LDKLPDSERNQLSEQLESPFLYGTEDNTDYSAIIINLGLRQVLHRTLLEGALTTVLKRFNYDNAPTMIRFNQSMLQRPRVKERLVKLLAYLTKSGSHITMHELLGFLSYAISSGVGKLEHGGKVKPYFDA